jgi:hypothetical protein
MLIFVCLSLFVLFGVIGLSVDLGYAYSIKMSAQTAADSAAQAAAIYASKNGFACGSGGLTCNTTYTCVNPAVTPPVTALEAGCLYAQANGFPTTGSQSVSLIANNTTPPNETGNTTPALWIQATVSQTVYNSFLFWAGFHSGSVTSQAIAGVTVHPPSSCVYVLSPSATDALNVTGSSSITSSGCSIYVNSTATTAAINDTGSSSINATGGGSVYAMTGAGVNIGGTSTISPTPTRISTGVADPFINLPAPTVSTTCTQTGYSLGSSNTATIGPGVYCGGITVAGSATLNLRPGMYIMNGGGFNNTHGGTINSVAFNGVTGVTIFLTGQNGFTAAGMQLVGNSVTNLSAPTSGTYQGVLFYQDRSVTYAGATANDLSNSATLNATGSLYFPTTALALTGDVATAKIALIVNTLSIVGSSTFDQDSSGTFTGLATESAGLIQ